MQTFSKSTNQLNSRIENRIFQINIVATKDQLDLSLFIESYQQNKVLQHRADFLE